jgi:hypothetical protein
VERSEVADAPAESLEFQQIVFAALPEPGIPEGFLAKYGDERGPDLPQEGGPGAVDTQGEAAP